MASVKKMEVCVRVMAAVLLALMMMVVAVTARPAKDAKLKDSSCSTSEDYVYPYWSYCKNPAELDVGYNYAAINIQALIGDSKLMPEYDETNDTYYVRLGSDGPTYAAVTNTDSSTLGTESTVYIYNTETYRPLAWRKEGTDEYFLIEKDATFTTDGDAFEFRLADTILPCPLLYPSPQCHAYTLVSSVGGSILISGLKAYKEGGITYVKAASPGSLGDLPLVVLVDSSSNPTTSAMPFPTNIRSVTAPGK